MNPKYAALLALLLLASCDGNPLGTGEEPPPCEVDCPPDDVNGVPPEVAVNLKAMQYDPDGGPGGAGSLRVTLESPGTSPFLAAFDRDASLDVDGYRAFTYQETGLVRSHLALVAENARGNLQAAAVSDGGQFNYRFGGGSFARIDTYTAPSSGVFSYTGSYAGVFVPGSVTTPGLPDSFQPSLPYRVSGDILMTGSFTNDLVEGGVDNRVVLDDSGNVLLNLDAITLKNTTIDNDGRFLGDVEFAGDPGSSAGDYGGLFGGIAASDVAGVLVINPIRGETGIWEFGVWNLARCGTAGEGPLCALQ